MGNRPSFFKICTWSINTYQLSKYLNYYRNMFIWKKNVKHKSRPQKYSDGNFLCVHNYLEDVHTKIW